jgi:hypothetical protein
VLAVTIVLEKDVYVLLTVVSVKPAIVAITGILPPDRAGIRASRVVQLVRARLNRAITEFGAVSLEATASSTRPTPARIVFDVNAWVTVLAAVSLIAWPVVSLEAIVIERLDAATFVPIVAQLEQIKESLMQPGYQADQQELHHQK